MTMGTTIIKRSPRSDLVLELAGPFERDAFGKLDLAGDGPAGLGDELDGIAVLDVQPDIIAEQAVLSLDRRRSLDDHDVGDLGERDLPDRGSLGFRRRPVWAATSRLRIAFLVVAEVARVTDDHGVALAALDARW